MRRSTAGPSTYGLTESIIHTWSEQCFPFRMPELLTDHNRALDNPNLDLTQAAVDSLK